MSEYEWICVTEQAAFAGRDGAGALVFKDRMWLLGGWNPGDKVNFPRRGHLLIDFTGPYR